MSLISLVILHHESYRTMIRVLQKIRRVVIRLIPRPVGSAKDCGRRDETLEEVEGQRTDLTGASGVGGGRRGSRKGWSRLTKGPFEESVVDVLSHSNKTNNCGSKC